MADKNSGAPRIPSWLTPLPPAAGGATPKPPVAKSVEPSPAGDSTNSPEKTGKPMEDLTEFNPASE